MVVFISIFVLASGNSQNLPELFNQVKSSVVVIHLLSKQNTGEGNPYQLTDIGGLGSGVLVSDDGYVLTVAHVVNDAAEIMVERVTDKSPAYLAGLKCGYLKLQIENRKFLLGVLN